MVSRRRQKPSRVGGRLALLAAAVPLACLAAAAPPPTTEPRGTAAEAAAAAESLRLAEALGRALDEPAERTGLRLLAESYEEGGHRAVEVFGRGIGIWNEERQFRASPAEIESAIRAVLDAGFARMDPTYGGAIEGRRRKGEPDGGGPVRLLCAVEIQADGVTRRVQQLVGGDKHGPLVDLAHLLLSQWRAAGEAGRAAAGLDAGLAAVAAGELAPETLRLTLHEKPELGTPGTGVLLRLRGRELSVREFATGSGYGPPRELELSEEKLRDLARRMARLSPARLPANLHATSYLDLTLEVLGHRIAVQARQFAGMTGATHGKLQRDFERLLEAVRALAAAGR